MAIISNRTRGQGLVEYAVLIVFIAVVIMVVIALMGPVVGNMYSDITSMFP